MIGSTTFLILGILEIATNLFHLSHGSIVAIGESAKRQHQELPLTLPSVHFFVKALTMGIFGILFTYAGASDMIPLPLNKESSWIVAVLFGIYGIVQAVFYCREWKVWPAMIVYNLPLVVLAREWL